MIERRVRVSPRVKNSAPTSANVFFRWYRPRV